MRTTLALDDDVLAAAKGLAVRQRKSIGEVVSALVRQALRPRGDQVGMRNDVPLLPVRADAVPATPVLVHQLRDEPG